MAPAKSSLSIILTLLLLSAGCLSDSLDDSGVTSTEEVSGNLVIWSTYETDSKEEEAFLDSVSAWQKIHPEVEVEVTSKP
jgi:ABC-type glycerol-3-phosphate transport system substrate-binding protein